MVIVIINVTEMLLLEMVIYKEV